MRHGQRGFGLVELMLALTIGLMLLAAASQLFASAHQAWRLQSTALRMQDEARQALLRMAQDIRMAGMFGCLRLKPSDFDDPALQQVFARPLVIEASTLSLIVAELPGQAGRPDWFLHTNCLTEVSVDEARKAGDPLVYPVSRYVYQLQDDKLRFKRGNSKFQPLVDNVQAMRVERVQMVGGERVDISLTLYEPTLKVQQHHELSVAIRNPVPAS
ncbi:pilus assembly protein PilW [Pseudomonas putida JB]|uniref:PilW family protein n=1 Tax=Pseudomonas TaxID=286 RepID=UPI000878D0D5|nr:MULTISPECIES: prepilin-type N-terminal cleavage/methylation domain-containing protein [Pseudomonas]AOX07414.1 pilus assembly protein PilW [Pseudomonas putida JB]MCI1024522.1 prepilin-type N-terminal cleavage/methylation domain-containing protein [Pseudomonas putida]MDN4515890.1 prepilin-type N-terminal cleavage/methylation domain-containing protein [Pseudomonas sp. 2,4-D]PWY43780.1 prepilin-type N-terminal cleavage/methylation domain-containing protein [Pseudomonas sp. RW405]